MPEIGTGESMVSASGATSMDSELLAAIKRSFPDVSQMPSEIKAMVEKSQGLANRQTIRELHLATTQLGKAKKCLDELTESRGSHRQAWMKYLKECTESLARQQEKFNEQEKQFTELMDKAKSEIKSARETIQTLSANAETPQIEAAPAPSPEAAAEELKGLQQQAEILMQRSSQALKDIKEEKVEMVDLSMEEDDEFEQQPLKRPRSVDPAIPPSS